MTDRTQYTGEAQSEEKVYLPVEKLLFRLRMLYRQYGYQPYRMSKFEKYELYAGNKDFLVSDRVITFNDTNGDLLALKPDVTLSIVKGAQFRKNHVEKLYYQENVYRPSGSAHQFREIMQCGLECIGDLDNYDVYEVLHLAAESLGTISKQSVLSVSHLGILKSLFTCLGAGEREQSEMLKLTAARNEHELAELFRMEGWDQNRLRDLRALMGLSCSLGQLPESLESLNLDWLDTSVRQIAPSGRRPFLLSDTVGFIDDLPTGLVDAFRSTLDEALHADLILMIVDSTDPEYRNHIQVTEETLAELGAGSIPVITVMNKNDGIRPILEKDRILMSAKDPDHLPALLDLIEAKLNEGSLTCTLLIPYAQSRLENVLRESGVVKSCEYTDDGIRITAAIRRDRIQQFQEYLQE